MASNSNKWWQAPLDFPPQPQPPHHHQHYQQQQQPAVTMPPPSSTAPAAPPAAAASAQSQDQPAPGAAGAMVPLRKPRGRPLGSKNKPKPPVIITRDSPDALHSHVLEVSPGADVSACVAQYARARGRGVCVLGASGTVADVAVRVPGAPAAGALPLTLPGRFELLSVTGTVLPPPAPAEASGLAVLLAAGQGQVLGGRVVGPLVAATPVTLFAATFANAVYERLPLQDDAVVDVKPNVSAADAQQAQQPQELPLAMSQAMAMGGAAGYPVVHRASPPYAWGGGHGHGSGGI
ncbi:AT-hook motif nuclear-localized protein 27 [Brachypodium distachyon]|uniref:AT-hook motif nuclear-localized protein n=1 Tax=Brachypodium distachyon TaxID=15368 RepID=A0A0Q3NJN9_BRADI|nr:AT-hook motif nuclear-localized protein 27 [Brachypodium distachyon]KQK17622.2 hypothetical protein BRADI_1g35720v3 [Brachypodium distachyon]|eukprot:XP_003560568.1 AT-hook motif nuclear-localized protein 27 [Brachypodium distachyon]